MREPVQFQRGERDRRTEGHRRVFGQGDAPMRPAGADEPLEIVLPMRAPDLLAPQQASAERDRGIEAEGREGERGEPHRPVAGRDADGP
ncbi:MAG: hypothetical protein ACK559_12765, partial [bacterium]